MNENDYESEYYTLTDEDGNETEFEVIGSAEIDGNLYYAMVPADAQADENDNIEYVVLKKENDDGEDVFVTVDDDEEFDRVADYFDDMFSEEADYDVN